MTFELTNFGTSPVGTAVNHRKSTKFKKKTIKYL